MEEAGANELNLIPYMDIMVNLVIFMLMSITGFLSFTILNASIPQLSTNPSQAAEGAKGEDLLLILRVQENSYIVEPTVTGGDPIAKRTIERAINEETKQREYDTEALNEFMQVIKERFPNEDKILIISQPDVKYDTIIITMDAVRETSPGLEDLFPEVTLSI